MELLPVALVSLTAFAAAVLTFFSGFGLGTLLMPVMALFFPVETAVGMTGVAHLFNNLFKLGLTGRHADKATLLRFGAPAIPAALAGAWLLLSLGKLPDLFKYDMFGKEFGVSPLKFTISTLLLIFAALEWNPRFRSSLIARKHLAFGGALSGFFGGLSGHQGALRSAFLIKAGLSKEAFVGTGVVVSALIDLTRVCVYGAGGLGDLSGRLVWVVSATLSAMFGAYVGHRLLKKVTLRFVQRFVALMLAMLALAMGAGWI
ncbi:MAG: sulfite exporter TauE/SafE family protein [Saprospiraceae bacterium]